MANLALGIRLQIQVRELRFRRFYHLCRISGSILVGIRILRSESR